MKGTMRNRHVLIYGNEEWRAWIVRARHALGLPNDSAVFDAALASLAERERLDKPPERVKPLGWNRYSEPEGGD